MAGDRKDDGQLDPLLRALEAFVRTPVDHHDIIELRSLIQKVPEPPEVSAP